MAKKPDLSVEFCGKRFINPFLLSSSPVSNTAEMIERAFEHGFGGVVYKSLGSPNVEIIHPAPRMQGYTASGARLVGVQNVEQTTDRSLKDNLADIEYLKKAWPDRVIIVSIMGFAANEWKELAIAAQGAGADMLELNFSCPHMAVEGAGMKVGQSFGLVQRFTEIVRRQAKVPIIAKLTSNVADICEPASHAKKGGADAITAINSVRALTEVGLDDFVPKPNVFGRGSMSGYTGPGIKPIGLRCIAELASDKDLGLPLSGCGGIETWVDAVEYMLCGATTLQMTTGVIHYGYRIVEDMIEGLSDYLVKKGFQRAGDLIGAAIPNMCPTSELDISRQGAASYDLERCIGCGQCYTVCRDAGAGTLGWDAVKRRPIPDEERCYSCMVCSFVCPVSSPPVITFKEVKGKSPYIAQPRQEPKRRKPASPVARLREPEHTRRNRSSTAGKA